jgi:hypothetical protein
MVIPRRLPWRRPVSPVISLPAYSLLLPGLSALLLPLFALVLPLSALHGAPEPQLSARGRCSVSDQATVWRASELLSYSRP